MSQALRECVASLIRIRTSIKIKVHIEGTGKMSRNNIWDSVLFECRPSANGDRDFPRWPYQTFIELMYKRTILKTVSISVTNAEHLTKKPHYQLVFNVLCMRSHVTFE